jgi:hypothetical protein
METQTGCPASRMNIYQERTDARNSGQDGSQDGPKFKGDERSNRSEMKETLRTNRKEMKDAIRTNLKEMKVAITNRKELKEVIRTNRKEVKEEIRTNQTKAGAILKEMKEQLTARLEAKIEAEMKSNNGNFDLIRSTLVSRMYIHQARTLYTQAKLIS